MGMNVINASMSDLNNKPRKSRFMLKSSTSSLACLSLLLMLNGCSFLTVKDDGEFRGITAASKWYDKPPKGMVLIPSGTFIMGGGVDQSVIQRTTIKARKTITRFYMDETVVTNAQYREFIEVVRKNPSEYDLTEEYINEHLEPDMQVWQGAFDGTFMGDSLKDDYYTNPRYSDYPVVGVTWQAAKVYAKVRSMYKNKALEERGLAPQPNYRLPTAAEWEYAAKGGIENAQYPWDGPFTRDSQGHILANFQSKVGDYSECGYTYPSPVRSFPPNKYGLYDMAGNVAEWCEDNYSPFLAKVSCVVNPVYRDSKTDFRVIKGGSWKDVSYSIQTGVLDGERQDIARCYIGFRCVLPAV